jgi:hypothetical protein
MNPAGILILELHQAATGAAVAKGFPLLGRHFPELFLLPERFDGRHFFDPG